MMLPAGGHRPGEANDLLEVEWRKNNVYDKLTIERIETNYCILYNIL